MPAAKPAPPFRPACTPFLQVDPFIDLIEEIAALKTDAELDGDMSGDEAVSVLSGLIERARDLV